MNLQDLRFWCLEFWLLEFWSIRDFDAFVILAYSDFSLFRILTFLGFWYIEILKLSVSWPTRDVDTTHSEFFSIQEFGFLGFWLSRFSLLEIVAHSGFWYVLSVNRDVDSFRILAFRDYDPFGILAHSGLWPIRDFGFFEILLFGLSAFEILARSGIINSSYFFFISENRKNCLISNLNWTRC